MSEAGRSARQARPPAINDKGEAPLQHQVLAPYTFSSPYSFSSAAENGPFFFWFRWVLPSCGGTV
jgi:hypothetical protein